MNKTELKAALYDLVTATGNGPREDATLNAAEDTLTAAIDRLVKLEEYHTHAEPLLRALANYVPPPEAQCPFCGCRQWELHRDDCSVTLARRVFAF